MRTKRIAAKSTGPSWFDVVDEVVAEVIDDVLPDPEPVEDYDWFEQINKAETIDAWCAGVYQLLSKSGAFTDANHVKRGYPVLIGEWPPVNRALAYDAFSRYANAVADGSSAKEAAGAVSKWHEGEVMALAFLEGELEEE